MADNRVIEHLRAIRTTLGNIERELGDVRHRVSSMERHLANLQSDMANVHLRLDNQGERLGRIERAGSNSSIHRAEYGKHQIVWGQMGPTSTVEPPSVVLKRLPAFWTEDGVAV